MKLKAVVKIYFLVIILSACQSKNKINSCDYFALGGFYANNHRDAKDSANHFQHNCHFLLLLQADTIEVYNRNSDFPNKNESFARLKLNENEIKRFKEIVSKMSNMKKITTENDLIYDGLTYIASKNTCQNTDFKILNFGIDENDENFIEKIFDKTKLKKNRKPSKRINKEKYFMTALLHQENHRKEISVKLNDSSYEK